MDRPEAHHINPSQSHNKPDKRVHIIQHESHEPSGHIADWLSDRSLEPAIINAREGMAQIDPDKIAILIILGGATNVHDQPQPEWLVEEKSFLAQMIKKPCPILGICLGSQLLADALGAQVRANELSEVGWHEVDFDLAAMEKAGLPGLARPDAFIEWHSQTFEIPDDAIRWASSQYCPNQAFVANGRHIGLQFHPEWTRTIVDRVAESEPAVPNGRNIQAIEQILNQDFDLTRPFLWGLLDHLWAIYTGQSE